MEPQRNHNSNTGSARPNIPGWITCTSRNLGRAYYYNPATGQAVWNLEDLNRLPATSNLNRQYPELHEPPADIVGPMPSYNQSNENISSDPNSPNVSMVYNRQIINNRFPRNPFPWTTFGQATFPNYLPTLMAQPYNPAIQPILPFDPNIWAVPPMQHLYIPQPTSSTNQNLSTPSPVNVNQSLALDRTTNLSNLFTDIKESRNTSLRTVHVNEPSTSNARRTRSRSVSPNRFNLEKSKSQLKSNDLRLRLVAKRRKSVDFQTNQQEESTSNEDTTIDVPKPKVERNTYLPVAPEPKKTKTVEPVTPRKKVTFKLNTSCTEDEESADEEDTNSEILAPRMDLTRLKQLAKLSDRTDRWYVVVDTNVMLSNLKFVDILVKSDELCRMMIPWRVNNELDAQSMRTSRTRSINLVKKARTARRYISQEFDKRTAVIGQSALEAQDLKFTCNVSDDDIINCCIQLIVQHYYVVLLSNDEGMCSKAKATNVLCFSVQRLKAFLSGKTPDKLFIPPPLKITVANKSQADKADTRTTVNSNIKPADKFDKQILKKCSFTITNMTVDKTNESNLTEAAAQTSEPLVKKINWIGPNSKSQNKTVQTSPEISTVFVNSHAKDNEINNTKGNKIKLNRQTFTNTSNLLTKRPWGKLPRSANKTVITSTNMNELIESKKSDTKTKPADSKPARTMKLLRNRNPIDKIDAETPRKETISETEQENDLLSALPLENLNFEEISKDIVIALNSENVQYTEKVDDAKNDANLRNNDNTSSLEKSVNEYSIKDKAIDESESLYKVKDKAMEERLEIRRDEWISRFIQIMEEVLTHVLMSSEKIISKSYVPSMQPPWTIHEATQCIVEMFCNVKDVQAAAKNLLAFIISISDEEVSGKIDPKLSPIKYMKLLGCGISLVKTLNISQPNSTDILLAMDMLNTLVKDIENPDLDSIDTSDDLVMRNSTTEQPVCLEDTRLSNDNNGEGANEKTLKYLKKNFSAWKSYKDEDEQFSKKIERLKREKEQLFMAKKSKANSTKYEEKTVENKQQNVKTICRDIETTRMQQINAAISNDKDPKDKELSVIEETEEVVNEEPKKVEPKIIRSCVAIIPEFEKKIQEKAKAKKLDMDMLDYVELDDDDVYDDEELEEEQFDEEQYDDYYGEEDVPVDEEPEAIADIPKKEDKKCDESRDDKVNMREFLNEFFREIKKVHEQIHTFCLNIEEYIKKNGFSNKEKIAHFHEVSEYLRGKLGEIIYHFKNIKECEKDPSKSLCETLIQLGLKNFVLENKKFFSEYGTTISLYIANMEDLDTTLSLAHTITEAR